MAAPTQLMPFNCQHAMGRSTAQKSGIIDYHTAEDAPVGTPMCRADTKRVTLACDGVTENSRPTVLSLLSYL
jgi:hypothetical protein